LIGNCLLRQLSAEEGAIETILFRDGKLTEASASNAYIVKDGVIATPAKTNLILPGITLDVVFDIVQRGKLPLELRDVTEAEVRDADELWVTSSSKEIVAIVELDRKVGEAIDIYVNDRLVARGEVVLVEDRLGVTMTEIIKAGQS